MHAKKYTLIAKTLYNLEEVLASELESLGAEEIEIGRRAVSFIGDKALLYKANLRLRTALRILKPIHKFKANDPDELYTQLRKFEWDSIMTVNQSFSIDTTVFSDNFSHSKYVGYRAKDAIVDYWRGKEGTRPNVSLDAPDIYINIHIAQTEITLSLDSSGESLHKRGYRDVQTDAPINEVLAAGILLKAGWSGATDLIDPMCGSGTFLIEAALIARNIAPGIYRKSFAFEQWLDYDAGLFEELYNDDSEELEFEHKIYGSDILPHAIRVSDSNVRRAGVTAQIQLDICSLQERPAPSSPALIVMNPPYGERLKLSNPQDLYSMIGERLKHNFIGCNAWIIAYKPEHFDSIGLKHNSRTELMNGSLECELRSYELFAGKREDFKSKPRPENRRREERKKKYTENGERRRTFGDRPLKDKSKNSSKARQDRTDRESVRTRAYNKPKRDDNSKTTSSNEKRNFIAKEKKGLWPSDRFNYTTQDGQVRRRKAPTQIIQTYQNNK